jgi:plastocyanin
MKLTGAGLVVGAGATTGAAGADHVDATINIDNVGASAYEVRTVTGTGIDVPTGVENPTLTVTETGTRVRFENGGYPNHPLEFRDESGTVLLSQSTTGSFNDDSAVNWVDDGDTIAFTITNDLASSLAEYRCTVHVNAMVGNVSVDAPTVDYTPQMGSVSFTSPSDGATVTTPVSFEMAAENFTVEAASNGVRDGAGHLHILVDQPAVEPGAVIPNNEPNGYYHYGDGSTTAEISLEPGTHTVRVQAGDAKHRAYDLTDTIQVTVEQPADPVERFDADGDGSIDRDEAVDAIVAYNDGSTVGGEEVTRDQAVQVIVDYNTG